MTDDYELLEGLWVSVDRVEQVEGGHTPPERPYQFVYYITIHNDSPRTISLTGRKWVITNSEHHKLVVEGDGIVGQFPRLAPGDQFHYNSYHLIDGSSTAEGAYFGRDENGKGILTRIPLFHMELGPSR